ncbi:TetR/AcrR family transcriptional regulator [Streptomyces sp. NPDC014676]|uniref:TetR/AcrR family transcriptional regulator n=1 Tax=Streptomyces sp. NPDC014676 TaxID=3364879 RepID=UPI0036FA005B
MSAVGMRPWPFVLLWGTGTPEERGGPRFRHCTLNGDVPDSFAACHPTLPIAKAMTPRRSPLRADAQRNRQHLIATATEVFASGQAISLDAIARRAGVGNATLYRHFPTREDLVEEVYRDQIRPLRDDALVLLETERPAEALHAWMRRFADWASERRGICEALVAMSASGRFGTGPVCDEVQRILAMMLKAGAEAGELRSDIDPIDVGSILASVLSVAGAPEQRDQLGRLLTIVVDGLRPR